jgi:hypothetical protein
MKKYFCLTVLLVVFGSTAIAQESVAEEEAVKDEPTA